MEHRKKAAAAAAQKSVVVVDVSLPPSARSTEASSSSPLWANSRRENAYDDTHLDLIDLVDGTLFALLLVPVFRALLFLNARRRQLRRRRRFGRHHLPPAVFMESSLELDLFLDAYAPCCLLFADRARRDRR